MRDLVLTIRATLEIYLECAKSSASQLLRNWIVIPGAVAAYTAFVLVAPLFAGLGTAGGMILGLAFCALSSLFYGWIASCINKERLSWSALIEFDYPIFSSLIGVGFILSLATLLLGGQRPIPGAEWISPVFSLAVFLVFNALPEIVYQHRTGSLQSFASAFEFIKEYWLEWYVPLLVILLPLILLSPIWTLSIVSGTDVLLPISIAIKGASMAAVIAGFPSIAGILFGLIFGIWFTIFRGNLFRTLEGGNRRRRVQELRLR